MVRAIVKLLIAALIINAGFRLGAAYWRYYQFQDALQQLAQFGERRSDRALCDQAIEKAGQLEVPISGENLVIRRGNGVFACTVTPGSAPQVAATGLANRIYIEGSYVEDLQLLPGYTYQWEFKPNVNAWIRP